MSTDPEHEDAHWSAPLAQRRGEVKRYISRHLRTTRDVEDLAQEVYVRLLDAAEPDNVEAFWRGVARKVLAGFRRGNWRTQQRLTIDSEQLHTLLEQPAAMFPDDASDHLHLQEQANRALARLVEQNPLKAAVLLQHDRDGLSYDEIAEQLNISKHTVGKYLSEANAFIAMMVWGDGK